MKPRRAGPVHLVDHGGAGVPVLLTHGMAAHSHWWDAVVPHLAGCHAVAMDFRGHGESEWAADGAYTSETWTADVAAAADALGWDRFVLVGHSMGARIALDFAERRPERLRGLVGVDFLPDFYDSGTRKHERTRTRPQPVYDSPEPMAEKYRLQPPGTLLTRDELSALGRKSLRRAESGWTWKFDWRAFTFPYGPVWPQLPRIPVPSLLVRGELSTIVTDADLEKMAAAMPAGRAKTVAGAHHHVPLDKPAELASVILAFAAELK
ncbi:MAG: alpha/beta hydrolase [Elusimicrobiota bacterium]|nr:alpha/beta hydrolase [Elusimicrobiota bacterium]